jgi:hypothetical protein
MARKFKTVTSICRRWQKRYRKKFGLKNKQTRRVKGGKHRQGYELKVGSP